MIDPRVAALQGVGSGAFFVAVQGLWIEDEVTPPVVPPVAHVSMGGGAPVRSQRREPRKAELVFPDRQPDSQHLAQQNNAIIFTVVSIVTSGALNDD